MMIQQGLLGWVLALVLGFPVLMIALGEIAFILEKREHPQLELVQILRNWVVPSLTAFLILQKVIRLPENHIFLRVVETILWITLIYWGLTFINQLLFKKAKQGTWRANVPKIFLDLSRTFLVLVGTAIVLSSVWGADLAGLLTALGVGSLVIGLALQDSLGNIFSGITLLFEKPLAIGDWVEIGEVKGQVLEITWRAVHVYTTQKHLVIVPNSELAQGNFRNFSRPEPIHGVSIELGFSCDDPPNKVIPVLKQTALQTIGVLPEPEPYVFLISYGDFSMIYQTTFFVRDYVQGLESTHDFNVRIWYATQRHNLTMPYPISTEYEYQSTFSTPENKQNKVIEILKNVSGWNLLSQETLDKISQSSKIKTFAKGEVIINQNQVLSELLIIINGKAEISILDESHHQEIIDYLVQGDIFAEKSALISGKISDTKITAVEDVEVIVIDNKTLQSLLQEWPMLASKIGELMELRRQQVKSII